ncbi:hypothetical protein [Kitasatospora phosalacinea]|uniref:HD domain-containing protein n=1 Tax=Kitasatospora phosalacinea TaxID=2065 RepID=UPI00052481E8|nr:hypothetical protein [Kitasatospora phosalacinea]
MEQQNSNTVSGSAVNNLVQAARIGTVHVHAAPVEPGPPTEEWAELVFKSAVWSQLRPGGDTEAWKWQTVRAAEELARVRDRLAPPLADDPWQDPDVVRRFVRAVGRLPGTSADGLLYPAEAAVLVLLPMLYRLRTMQLACGERPTDGYGEDHRRLADRARTDPDLAGWLWHRHLARQAGLADPAAVTGLRAAVTGPEVRAALLPAVVLPALDGLRRGIGVANPEFLQELRDRERIDCDEEQYVRPKRLTLLTALAHALALENTALPEIVADHLGIEDPVVLSQLHATLRASSWGGSRELPVLKAECHHQAVVEALREYIDHADELLHAVQRTLDPEVTGLPLRLSAANVAPVPGAFKETARFRLDERRMQALLMGVQLYRDRDLAVRELYQNALDACRYRRARADFLARDRLGVEDSGYRGEITFEQGIDAQGRPYLQCRDNGVGMGEAELRGVFSKAGERFAEQQELRQEREKGRPAPPPVELYPNSRFGIGVLSYFMLGERMTVTTCRMDPENRCGPELEASIYGPGHLFPIKPTGAARTVPGTTIRLYLDQEVLPEDWSAVNVLERLLGIAEFETVATHGEHVVRWEPRQLRQRADHVDRRGGVSAAGKLVPWEGAPPGAQVIWCERGGDLLVDGLYISSVASRSDTEAQPTIDVSGVVVNLTGPYSPKNLSVDRTTILDDVSETLHALLRPAARALVEDDHGLLTDSWLSAVSDEDPWLADLLTSTVRQVVSTAPPSSFLELVSRGGFYGTDRKFVPRSDHSQRFPPLPTEMNSLPWPWLLWRLLAHRPNPWSAALTDAVPELDRIGCLLPALPSDQLVLDHLLDNSTAPAPGHVVNRGSALTYVFKMQPLLPKPLSVVAQRLRELRIRDWWDSLPVSVSELRAMRGAVSDGVQLMRALDLTVTDEVTAIAAAYQRIPALSVDGYIFDRGSNGTLEPGAPVPLGYLAAMSRAAGHSMVEMARQLVDLGLSIDPAGIPDHITSPTAVLLSRDFDNAAPWVDQSVTPNHLLRSAVLSGRSLAETVRTFEDLGYSCPPLGDLPVTEFLPLVSRFFPPEGGRLPIRHTLDMSSPLFLAIAQWIARRSAESSTFPEGSTADGALMHLFRDLGMSNELVTDSVPFAALLSAARDLGIGPADLAARLNAQGLPTSCVELPFDLPQHTASRLWGMAAHTVRHSPHVPLMAAVELKAPLPRVAEWLRVLGHDAPDPVALIREAIPFVPLAEG